MKRWKRSTNRVSSVLHLKYQLANLIALKRCRSGIEVQISTQSPRVEQSKEKERYGTAALCLVGLLFFGLMQGTDAIYC